VFGLGGWRGFILIPEGLGGWGWRKFFGELSKISTFLFAAVGCGSESSVAMVSLGGKKEEETLGLSSSFVLLGSLQEVGRFQIGGLF